LVAVRGRPAAFAFGCGVLFGMGFFGLLAAWVAMIGVLAWLALSLCQAVFIGVFAASWAVASRRLQGLMGALAAASLWVAVEYLRSRFPLGGFPWGQIAQSQHDYSSLLSLAAFGGGWAVSFVVVFVNAVAIELFRGLRTRRTTGVIPVAAGVALLVTATVAAGAALAPPPAASGPAVRVAIVQGSTPLSFDGTYYEKQVAILRSHLRLTRDLLKRGVSPDIVVWPESSIGIDLDDNPWVVRSIGSLARRLRATIIAGGNLEAGPDHYKVMAFEFSPDGRLVGRYRKTHLVPFGEYLPFRGLLDWLPGTSQIPRDAVAGHEPVLFDTPHGKVAPVISYEGDFGPLVRNRIAAGGRLLVVATNTSTWGRSSASLQHLAFSQVRAAENGVWVVHASIAGTSAFVAPDGGVVSSTPLWERATMAHTVHFSRGTTFYARTGDWLAYLCLALGAICVIAPAAMTEPVAEQDGEEERVEPELT
jgi:apolipoprotein N-acyltransferase